MKIATFYMKYKRENKKIIEEIIVYDDGIVKSEAKTFWQHFKKKIFSIIHLYTKPINSNDENYHEIFSNNLAEIYNTYNSKREMDGKDKINFTKRTKDYVDFINNKTKIKRNNIPKDKNEKPFYIG